MKKISLVILSLLCVCLLATAQEKFFTKNGRVDFDGRSTFSKIHAGNNSAICVLDIKTGLLQISLLVRGFEFKKSLMEKHFNDRYLETDKFPKSEFKGQVINNNTVNYSKHGVYDVTVKGELNIHGETKGIEAKGKITVSDDKIILTSVFIINVPDYNIKAGMSDEVTITFNGSLEPFNK